VLQPAVGSLPLGPTRADAGVVSPSASTWITTAARYVGIVAVIIQERTLILIRKVNFLKGSNIHDKIKSGRQRTRQAEGIISQVGGQDGE
jgi:hypothetical protein